HDALHRGGQAGERRRVEHDLAVDLAVDERLQLGRALKDGRAADLQLADAGHEAGLHVGVDVALERELNVEARRGALEARVGLGRGRGLAVRGGLAIGRGARRGRLALAAARALGVAAAAALGLGGARGAALLDEAGAAALALAL